MKATANGSGTAAPVSAASAPNLLTIDITPTIERDYKRREVFAELRIENAARIVNGATGRYEVTIERARAVYADAEHMRWGTMALPRGLACARTGSGRTCASASASPSPSVFGIR